MSLQWYEELPTELQDALDRASEQTFKANLSAVPEHRKNTLNTLREAGVGFRQLSDSEMQKWKEEISYKLPVWDQHKKRLAGDMEMFSKFEQAVQTNNGYTVESFEIPK